jgi:hypothetical protein
MTGRYRNRCSTQHFEKTQQFQDLVDFQPCVYAETLCFCPVVDNFIQIADTHPKVGDLYWVAFTILDVKFKTL